MAKFLTPLCVDLSEDSDCIWILNKPLVYNSDLVGQVVVPAGFNSDLASVPRVPFVYSMWGGRSHHEAVVHDLLFRIDAKPEVSWMNANRVFLEAMKVRNKPFHIRYPMFWGVCIGSYSCWKKRLVKDC